MGHQNPSLPQAEVKVDCQGNKFYVEVRDGAVRRVYLPKPPKWTRPYAQHNGRTYAAPVKPRRQASVEFLKLCSRSEAEVRAVIVDGAAQGMKFSEVCASLGVGVRAVTRYFKTRPDMREAWAKAKMGYLFQENEHAG